MKDKVTFAILAGGKSSRMGTNKALLTYRGNSFLEGLSKMGREIGPLVISANRPERYSDVEIDGAKWVFDQLEDFGPLEGIYQVLNAIDTEYAFVVATDMPYLQVDFLKALISRLTGDEDALVLVNQDGKPEPLCSIYRRTCIPVLKDMRSENLHRPRFLFDRVKTEYVNIEDTGFDPMVFSNINTPEDYQEIQRNGD